MALASRLREVIIISLYSVLARSHLKSCAQFRAAHYKKDAGKLEEVQWRGTKVVMGTVNMLFKETLRN